MSTATPLFQTGEIVATPCFVEELKRSGEDTVVPYLERHRSGDWGDISERGRQGNGLALTKGLCIFSVYHMKSGVKFLVVTAGDRSNTAFCLPEEY